MQKVISIIIPVYNDAEAIEDTLLRIKKNKIDNYTKEVIVVDNGSTDETVEIVKRYNDVKLLFEYNYLNSPYSARNRGIEVSNGDIIVLLDSTCRPSVNWLSNGVDTLTKKNADIIAGNVLFDFQGKKSAGKIYDSLTNINMKESVERGVAKTANLFIRKEVFNKVGMFVEGVRSGADVRWTRKATRSDCELAYSEKAIVYKIARTSIELIKKQWRVGLGQPEIWLEEDNFLNYRRYFSISRIMPPNLKTIIKKISIHGTQKMKKYLIQIMLVGYFSKLTMLAANLIGLRRVRSNKNNT
ncbi:glycosyltransferase family 2 protein [Lentibacillus sp. CBA3610]|uniref:glycosyltransferase n=1 Tax=Lentibacillus sp. CBA3610 TaxID=2518176 RepID=UPI001595F2A6|nr:glycosyltransferase [Lentibacillus sp. CBA3610]